MNLNSKKATLFSNYDLDIEEFSHLGGQNSDYDISKYDNKKLLTNQSKRIFDFYSIKNYRTKELNLATQFLAILNNKAVEKDSIFKIKQTRRTKLDYFLSIFYELNKKITSN
jgi:hypothetical protein